MAIFKDIEKRLENLLEGFFNNQFRSALQPIELAHKLAAEMDRGRRLSVAHNYAPNIFAVSISADDMTAVEGFKASLLGEVSAYLTAYAKDKQYFLTGSVDIFLGVDTSLKSGDCEIISHIEETSPTGSGHTEIISAEEARQIKEALVPAWFEIDKTRVDFPQYRATVTLGRHSDNDVVLPYPGVSRRHAVLEWADCEYILVDQNSTNGILVNGERVDSATLRSGDEVILGDLVMIFRHA